MRKHLPHRLDGPEWEQFSALLCLSACFMLGGLAGCLFAGFLGESAQTHLSAYLNGYFTVLRDGETALPSLFSTAWELGRWPLFTFLLGFTALGAIGIPAVFCARGFLLSYCVAVFVRLFGSAGLLAALALFGVSAFCALPALFVLGVGSFRGARALAASLLGEGRHGGPLQGGYMLRVGVCALLLAAGVAVQTRLTPALLHMAAGLIC